MLDNIILATDSYKLGHWKQYPSNTRGVYSYLEARVGAKYDETVFFGLQSMLKQIAGQVVTADDVHRAYCLAAKHFGDPDLFNLDGWEHIVEEHGGCLPLRIRAVPEGSVIPVGNVLMTVENTCPDCFWLTNALESFLLHVWYPTTVATVSYNVKKMLKGHLEKSADALDALPFMLHDFGYRGATTHEAAAIGGAGHLVSFMGTDTLPAMELLMRDYGADLDTLAFSVPATEHSVMTSNGPIGERPIVADLITNHPTGILSVVGDSYDIYRFVDELGTVHRDAVLAREGKFVTRPDSVTPQDPTPELLVLALLEKLGSYFGMQANNKGYNVLNPKVGLIWGDGISPEDADRILTFIETNGWSAENIVFGMGGGLLQKVNRDTQRFAFKCSAQKRDGVWRDVQKQPLDASKTSKAGRLKLSKIHEIDGVEYETTNQWVPPHDHVIVDDVLETVFENGKILRFESLDKIRERAAL